MPVTIISVGKPDRALFLPAVREYARRITRFDKLTLVEVPDVQEPAGASAAQLDIVRDREGESILARIRQDDYVVAMCIEARQCDSLAFSDKIRALRDRSQHMVFVIGGSLGLGQAVYRRANETLSLSSLTFPHQLARVVLLEQLYRAYKIIANERYHK
ncbi:MAG: 23S rRNA (pseudouridine(1915)-N(3))-methyltransferase RlmH [Clostridiales bacterium]|jgi:23S rRNA (pseudouridine1915-N3)-methyltransferase|nr:23S rRNA (pseudouridine(1915)-N(3))-methyltransferase RlmH [Clostridiales bacterium]